MNLLKFIDFYWACPLDLKPLKIREQHLTECFRWRQSNLTCTVQFRHRGPPVLIGQECSVLLGQKDKCIPKPQDQDTQFLGGILRQMSLFTSLFTSSSPSHSWDLDEPNLKVSKAKVNGPNAWRVNQAALIMFICGGKLIIACSQVCFSYSQ